MRHNLVDRLRGHAALKPDALALRFLEGDAVGAELSYAALDARIRALAAHLQESRPHGERALLLFPSGVDYVVAFHACLYAGVIAVPAYPPEGGRAQHGERLAGILRDAEPRFILTIEALREAIAAALPPGTQARIVAVDAIPTTDAGLWREESPDSDAIAFLQYTSGSTSAPKGVCVSHANLEANELAIGHGFGMVADDVVLSWLPLYHDMGLIGGLLQPLHLGVPALLMSPRSFIEQPRRWLEAITRHGATVSGGPDFAYALCLDRIGDAVLETLDLGAWRLAFSGSEFVRAATLERFAARFAPAGFSRRAFLPCYGLAEATLFVTSPGRGVGARVGRFDTERLAEARIAASADGDGTPHVALGGPSPDHHVRIMRPDGSGPAETNAIGEIWAGGPSIAGGYWRNAAASQATFVRQDGIDWLRTGDLGFLREGQLYVTGRIKDMLIVRGQNLYPQDIEAAIEAELEMVRRGRVAAFPVEIEGREGIGITAEFGRGTIRLVTAEALHQAIAETVTQQCGEAPAVVALLNPRGMPLTTSGKLQRAACAKGWARGPEEGGLDAFATFVRGRRLDAETAPETTVRAETLSETECRLAEIWRTVLRIETIGPEDDFFVLGGNSLSAAEAAAALHDSLGRATDLGDVYRHPTLRAFARFLDATPGSGAPAIPPIRPASREKPLPLSHAQERLWFLWQLDSASTAYTVAGAIRLHGALDAERLLAALEAIVRRHEALRTTIAAGEGGALQHIHAAMPVPVRREDLSALPASEQAGAVAALTDDALALPFDLAAGPLVRVSLIRLGEREHELLLTAHHIVADGVSMGILLDELGAFYRGLAPSTAPAIHYADYALWQRDWLALGEGERQLAFWRESLGEDHPVLALPHDRPRPAEQSHRGDSVTLAIAPDLAGRLRGLARAERASVFAVLHAAYALLLHRYSGQDDIRVGVPTANRRLKAVEGLIGFFVNTLVMRAAIDPAQTFSSLVGQSRERAIAALAHQDLPFERLVERLAPQRSLGHNPIFQAKLNYMAAPRGFEAVDGLDVDIRILDLAGAHFDLALDIVDGPEGMKTTFNYASDLFDRATIEAIAQNFHGILAQAVEEPDRRVGAFALGGESLTRVSMPAQVFPVQTVLDLFRAARTREPEAVALTDAAGSLTYDRLDARSDAVAAALAARGCGPETRCALLIERSNAFVVGLLGVLKAGACAVPLDPSWPESRIRSVIDDAGIAQVLAAGDTLPLARRIGQSGSDIARAAIGSLAVAGAPESDIATVRAVLDLDALGPAAFAAPRLHPDHAAYVIYTSGSTGRPKGVVVSHGALADYVQGLLAAIGPEPGASMAMVSTVAADLGHTVLFGALASGARLDLFAREAAFDAAAFAARMRNGAVETLKIVPSHMRGLIQAEPSGDALPSRLLVLGGEALDSDLVDTIRRLRPGLRLLNHYGPTETTVGVLTHAVAPGDVSIPLGLPLANVRIHILDAALNPVPAGVPGELFVGGPSLARGYLGAPGPTAARFVPDPFGPTGGRLYRTGDRARVDGEGRVHFLGRADDQIKLRGYRIEPGEIARVLAAQAGIGEAVVLVREIGESRGLVGYCTPAPGALPDPDALKAALAAALPDYMVPAHILVLDAFPLTANGKLDRKALPLPEANTAIEAAAAPENPVEQAIAEVWAQVLRRTSVGVTDNFFELGGDSILSLQVIARLRKRGIKLTPKQIFDRQTILRLAEVAGTVAPKASAKPAAPTPAEARPIPLLPLQDRFFEDVTRERHHWNQALLLVPGERLEPAPLSRALNALVAHHEALRQSFAEGPFGWQAVPLPAAERASILRHERAADPQALQALCAAAQASLDLSAGRLVQALLAEMPDGSQRLLIVIHHLAVDGVSWRILLEDLEAAYGQARHGQAIALGTSATSLAAWAEGLRALAASAAVAAALPIWTEQAEGVDPTLPGDWVPEGPETLADSETVETRIDPALTARLLAEAPSAYRTRVDDLLLAALSRALAHWTGREASLVELEGHGREEALVGGDVSRTVGWFTSVVPVRLDHAADTARLIQRTKERLRALPQSGLGHGLLARFGSQAQRRMLAALPQPQVTFNYLGQLDAAFGPDTLFALAEEGSGPTRSPAAPLTRPLVIDASVRDGALRLTWRYGRRRHERATIERLAEGFSAALHALVAHCTGGAAGLTPSDLPLSGLDQAGIDALIASTGRDPRAIEDVYPLTPIQAGILFHALHDEGAHDTYVSGLAVTVEGASAERLRSAWQAATRRHAALRTGIHWRGIAGIGLQVVERDPPLLFAIEDRRGADAAELAAIAAAERAAGFTLETPPLQRVRLIRLDDSADGRPRHRLIWTSHHILMDGWSSARLMAEVLGGDVPAEPGAYRDYVAWLGARDAGAASRFWADQLAPLDGPTLVADAFLHETEARETGHAGLRLTLDGADWAALRDFARRERVTLNTLVQAAWALVLRRLTSRDAVVFGTTVAGRPAELPGAQTMLGLFINTLPLVETAPPSLSVGDWLRALQAQNLAMREHEHTPLQAIQRQAGLAGQALFDSILVFENYPVDAALLRGSAEGGASLSDLAHASPTHYALTLTVFAGEERLDLDFDHDLARIGPAEAERLRVLLARSLTALSRDPDTPVGAIALADEGERAALVSAGSAASLAPAFDPVHVVFARHAASRPEAEAVWCDEVSLSYGALEDRANRLAHHLIGQGIGRGAIVAVAMSRSSELIVALLAVLKAGAAYLPLDPKAPAARLAHALEDAGAALLVTDTASRDGLPEGSCPVLVLDRLDVSAEPGSDPGVALHPDDLAYVIYTSGSTGIPKGVSVAHGPFAMHCAAAGPLYGLDPSRRELLFLSFAFDAAHERLWTALTAGASLVLRDEALWSPERTLAVIAEQGVTNTDLPPAYLQELAAFASWRGEAPAVALYSFGGEAMPRAGFELVARALRSRLLINGYGPTEAVVTPLAWKAEAGTRLPGPVAPIGSPVGSRSAHVLDGDLQLVPDGVTGELYLGGYGLARGYLGRAGLTGSRFVPDPYGAPGSRLYRTGDLACRLADGTFLYRGRIDDQVKIRGHRIEPGEVEARLLALPGVAQAAVVAREGPAGVANGALQLVGYAAPAGDEVPALDGSALRAALAQVLPDYMVPSHVVVLDRLPLTANGKLDRKGLPAPERAEALHVAPRTETETAVAAIWGEVLGLAQVGVTQNFFELGGDSIQAVRVVSRLRERFAHPLSPKDLFDRPSVEALATLLAARDGQAESQAATLDALLGEFEDA